MQESTPISLTEVSTDASLPAPPRLRLEFLDGLRGLAALYVVLYHAYQLTTFDDSRIDAALVWRIGHPAVAVFIVLSGFCLTLPIVRSGSKSLRGGPREYFKRRAWRILPPYYAALVLSALFLVMAHAAKYRTGFALHDKVLGLHLSPGSLLSHLFLVHNLDHVWIETIDVPMWSVATEWQIYFFLPALLLPVWRRFGALAAVVAGFAAGLLPHYLLPPGRNFDGACPWYLGLFALGMGGAILAFSPRLQASWRERLPWGGLAAVLFLLLGALIVFVPDALISGYVWQTDALAGAAALCLILHGTALVTAPHARSATLAALEARPTLWLGAFSYSLYLVHYPILNKVAQLLDARHLPLGERMAIIYLFG
ncbi:MAG: acyltransferase, partial [Armatimonadota bacterium]|nr:acyltransferase [Armatimonadota bacterium]